MNNCINKKDLGCVSALSKVDFPTLVAAQTGVHTFTFKFTGAPIELSVIGTDTEAFNVDTNGLNEYYTYTFQITQPDGTLFTLTEGQTVYNCFQIEIIPFKKVYGESVLDKLNCC